MGAYELQVVTICQDCVYFNEYGRLDDQAMSEDPLAGQEHAAKIAAAGWPQGTEFTSGCGRDCDDHGIKSFGFPGFRDWRRENPGTKADYKAAREEAWEDAQGDTDTWFSWSACDECGDALGGTREHATAWTYTPPPGVTS